MREDNPKTEFSFASLLTSRNLLFGGMALAVAAVVLFEPGRASSGKPAGAGEKKSAKKTDRLRKQQRRFLVKILVRQSAWTLSAPAEGKKELIRTLRLQLAGEGAHFGSFAGVHRVQKYMILDLLGARPTRDVLKNFSPHEKKSPLYADFVRLYFQNKSLAEDSPLFKAAAGDLARIKQFRLRKENAKAGALEAKLRGEFGILINAGFGLLLFFVIGYPGTMIYLMFKRPAGRFFSSLEKIPQERRRILLEATILELFLLFVVIATARGYLPRELFTLPLNALYMTLGFAIAFAYALRGLGAEKMKVLLFDAPLDRVWKEFIWGFMGFAVIFPLAIVALLLSSFFFGTQTQDGLSAAHPAVFFVKEHTLTIFFMGVVLAPLSEEIVFRAFLYGAFRGYFQPFVSALLNGAVFAMLHPQGLLAMPALLIMGMGFCILREIRPGIVAPVTTHMLVNGLSLSGAYYLMTQ